jgi:hypothetical protein
VRDLSDAFSDAFIQEISREFPRFRIVPKAGNPLSRAIDIALRVVTLGGQRHYMTRYHTVLGDTLYVPLTWPSMAPVDRVILLRHERVHLRQRRRYGFVGMAFLYVFVWFPLGLAYGRARIEWEAYRETLAATAELKGMAAARDVALREHIIQRFLGPDYGWMWPFRSQIDAWYDEALAGLDSPARPVKDSLSPPPAP